MRNILYILFFVIINQCFSVYGQNTPYWQQQVNNRINVTLDDVHNRLRGNIEIEYINNSPDKLNFIWFHVWPNAYKDLSTAFAKQKLRNRETSFYYADIKERGFIDSLSFSINGTKARLEIDSINPDLAKLFLNEPLIPGGRILIYTPFRVQLPYTFSRGGHVGNSYQVSQWFPKPAVYDKKGWHPIPYLDQGEFYAEFGKYDVSITVPENYKVAATGNLQTESEKEWLEKLANANAEKFSLPEEHAADMSVLNTTKAIDIDGQSFPSSSSTFKTIRYTQDNIHDFAWFADKRFHVLKSHVTIPNSGKVVTTWAFFLDKREELWKLAPWYIDSSIYYYSKWVGPYLYDNCTSVEGPLVAGDGMEYPTINIIGDMNNARILETVIAHEVGHNWFQGALAFNERGYPWMDEGINSYYERRYIEHRNPNYNGMKVIGKFGRAFFDLDSATNNFNNYLALLFQERRHEDQPMCLTSTAYTKFNYGAMIYAKFPYSMRYLEKYLGTEEFDKVMQSFYKDWQLKHPQPEDMEAHFNKETGKELDWFFKSLLCTTEKLDYKIVNAKDTIHIGGKAFVKITVRNTGGIKGPFSISAFKKDSVIVTQWFGGFFGVNKVLLPYDNYDAYRIDAIEVMPEYNRHNNTLRAQGILKKIEPFRLQPLGNIENPYHSTIYFTPTFGYNKYDGTMFGAAFYNSFIPVKNTEILLIPLFSTNTNTLRGIGRLNTFIYPKGNSIQYVQWMTTASVFAFRNESYLTNNYYDDNRRISTQLNLKLKNKNPNLNNIFTFRYIFLSQESENFSNEPPSTNWTTIRVFQLKYQFNNKRKVNPYSLELTAESYNPPGSSGIQRNQNMREEFKYRFSYNDKKGLDIRVFSEFASGIDNPTLFANGATDYTFDHYFIGRSETSGLASHQLYEGFGFMKFNPGALLSTLGIGQSFVASINLKSDLPIPLFFLFADGGYYNVDQTEGLNNFLYDAGVGMRIIPGILELYLPLFVSKDIKLNIFDNTGATPQSGPFYSRIMFTLQLEQLDIFKMIRNEQL